MRVVHVIMTMQMPAADDDDAATKAVTAGVGERGTPVPSGRRRAEHASDQTGLGRR